MYHSEKTKNVSTSTSLRTREEESEEKVVEAKDLKEERGEVVEELADLPEEKRRRSPFPKSPLKPKPDLFVNLSFELF